MIKGMTKHELENEIRVQEKKYGELSRAYDRLKKQYYDLDDMYIRNVNILQLLAKKRITELFTQEIAVDKKKW
jgi:hypothetical protein